MEPIGAIICVLFLLNRHFPLSKKWQKKFLIYLIQKLIDAATDKKQ